MISTPQPLEINRCPSSVPVPVNKLQRAARFLYKIERIPPARGISVVFCSDTAIRKLNVRYRHIDRATDVLSFYMGDDDMLGEIYISLLRAAVQARRFHVTCLYPLDAILIRGLIESLN